jgi:hypothetical protein
MRIKLFEEFSNEELETLDYEIKSRCIWLEDEGFDIEVARVKESLHPVLRIKITKGQQTFDILDINDYVMTISDYLRRNYEDVKINYVINNKVYDTVLYRYFKKGEDTTCKLFYMRCKLGKLKNT